MSEDNFQPRKQVRRFADEELRQQVVQHAERQAQIFQQLTELSFSVKEIELKLQMLDERHSHMNVTVLAEAIRTSQKELLLKVGVDIDKKEDMERFKNGIYFSQSMHKGVTTAAFTILTAFCVGVGYSLWAITTAVFKVPN
jgi:acetoin utilization deacetylase AcuC-like enzyme